MGDEAILRRLDRIQAILRLAFADEMGAMSRRIRSDAVSDEILNRAVDWVGSTELQAGVAKATSKSSRTVRDRLGELVEQGALETRGTERRVEYRSTGLV